MQYILEKDGLYLMNYLDTGVEEWQSDGSHRSVLTGLYGPGINNARIIEDRRTLEKLDGNRMRVKEGKLV